MIPLIVDVTQINCNYSYLSSGEKVQYFHSFPQGFEKYQLCVKNTFGKFGISI